jgi:hypothetical protein
MSRTVCSVIIIRAVVAATAAVFISFAPLTAASASEADEVVGLQPVSPPAPPVAVAGEDSYRDRVNEQLDLIDSVPRATAGTGGPKFGAGSDAVVKDSGLPQQVVSLWPSPGAELLFPNRESRISFRDRVDSRTFQGRILDATTGKVAIGDDGAPALFTRSTITATEALDVIGTYPTLGAGSYLLEWSVITLKGERLTGEVAFTQLEPIVAPGGGNHRHGQLRIPFEKELTTFARVLVVAGFALLFRRRGEGVLLPGVLAVGGLIHMAAFLITASDTILTTGELLGRLDGWAAAAVLASAVLAALARTRGERAAAVWLAGIGVLATTYIPNMAMSVPIMVLLSVTMYGAGRWAAAALGWSRDRLVTSIILAATIALAPVSTVVLAAGTFAPQRGLGEDLRFRLLGAAVVIALSAMTLAAERLIPTRRFLRIPFAAVAVVIATTAAIMTTAPALL